MGAVGENWPEFFPPREELEAERRARANVFVGRMQSIARMAIEFCSKMQALGVELNSYEGTGSNSERGFVIPVITEDTDCGRTEELWFVGPQGFFAPYQDDEVGLPLLDTLDREGIVEPLKDAMTEVLCGHVRVVYGGHRSSDVST